METCICQRRLCSLKVISQVLAGLAHVRGGASGNDICQQHAGACIVVEVELRNGIVSLYNKVRS